MVSSNRGGSASPVRPIGLLLIRLPTSYWPSCLVGSGDLCSSSIRNSRVKIPFGSSISYKWQPKPKCPCFLASSALGSTIRGGVCLGCPGGSATRSCRGAIYRGTCLSQKHKRSERTGTSSQSLRKVAWQAASARGPLPRGASAGGGGALKH